MEVISFFVEVKVIPQKAQVDQEAVKATDFLYVQHYNCCLLSHPHETFQYSVWAELRMFYVKLVVHIVTTGFYTPMKVTVYRESLKNLDLFTSSKFIMYFMKQNNIFSLQKYRYLANYTVLVRNVQLLF